MKSKNVLIILLQLKQEPQPTSNGHSMFKYADSTVYSYAETHPSVLP
jgi:hypothetical protein